MEILKTNNQQVQKFQGRAIPNYSILNLDGSVRWAYIPDVEAFKAEFERRFPALNFHFQPGPTLYYYKVWSEIKAIDETVC